MESSRKKDKVGETEIVKDNIFDEAVQISEITVRRTTTVKPKDANITEANIHLPTDKKTRTTFDELKDAVENEHAERFNNVLHTLPDREFVRVYLKTLEFFKPKVVRQLGDQEKEKDTTINILIKR